MKTITAKRAYLKGVLVGLACGLPLAAAFASLMGGERFRLLGVMSGKGGDPEDLNRAIVGGIVGMAIGVLLGIAGAALLVATASKEAREQAHEPEPVVEDTGLAHAFPGVFGTADPFEPFKRRIDAEEAAEAAAAPPTVMPAKCPACAKDLDPAEPVAFCYHCGAALS